MGILDKYFERQINKQVPTIVRKATKEVVTHVDNSLFKAQQGALDALPQTGLKRYEFYPNQVNGNMQSRKKAGANISFETMRRFSVNHEVTRACINLRKRQIAGLEWDIVATEKDQTKVDKSATLSIKEFIKNLGGRGNGYRVFMDKFIEDLLVLDAVAEEKQKTVGNKLLTLLPIDAATIRLRVNESGATPEPPEAAYVQVIRGQRTAELTTDEMIYLCMNPRNDSPYGLSPLESLMIVITSSLKAGMYNLAYLTDGNIPEGFYTMPETWQPQQIKDFQEYFDAQLAGDETVTRRLKFMPQGDYMPTTKPSDMAFQEFNDWLLKLTCAMFEVSPMDIGFAPKTGLGGKGFSEEQSAISERKGLAPLANFIEEFFTKIVQEELGYTDLKFQYTGLVEHDEKSIAEVNEILIRSGQRTINEIRTDEGLQPIEGGEKPFFAGQVSYLGVKDAQQDNTAALPSKLQSGVTEEKQKPQNTDGDGETEPKESERTSKRDRTIDHIDLVTELRTFRKYALKRIEAGKQLRKFESDVLPIEVVDEINDRLNKVSDVDKARDIFHEYMDDYRINFLANAEALKSDLKKVLT